MNNAYSRFNVVGLNSSIRLDGSRPMRVNDMLAINCWFVVITSRVFMRTFIAHQKFATLSSNNPLETGKRRTRIWVSWGMERNGRNNSAKLATTVRPSFIKNKILQLDSKYTLFDKICPERKRISGVNSREPSV